MSKITAEEYSLKKFPISKDLSINYVNRVQRLNFINGANWQKEQMQEHTKQNIEALRGELHNLTPYEESRKSIENVINQFLENIK